jgi:hypothetical protein
MKMHKQNTGGGRARDKRFIFASLALIFFASSGFVFAQQSRKSEVIRLGQEFELKIDQQATIEGEGLAVAFESVLEDSRCPESATCVWEGNARIKTRLSNRDQTGEAIKLNTNTKSGPKSSSFLNYEIILVALNPYPKSGGDIRPDEYKATLIIKTK